VVNVIADEVHFITPTAPDVFLAQEKKHFEQPGLLAMIERLYAAGVGQGLKMANPMGELIARQWRERDLAKPRDGNVPGVAQPFYLWRLTDSELLRGWEIVRRYLGPNGNSGPEIAACFCLAAAHTLQRSYGRGDWSWRIVTDALGILLDQGALRDLTARGFSRLRRQVREDGRGKQYFRSLIVEGGIPAVLIENGTGSFARYLRGLQTDLDDYDVRDREIAERFANQRLDTLPPTWRREDTVALAADLLLAIRRLRDTLPPDFVASRAILLLDERDASWREQLPLPLNDAGAEQLLGQLIVERRTGRGGREPERSEFCRRGLVRGPDAWQSVTLLEAAGRVGAGVLPDIPFASGDPPDRVRLFVDLDDESGASIQPAMLEHQGEKRWRFAPTVAHPLPVQCDRPFACRMVVDRDHIGMLSIPGGAALPVDLPWTLVDDDGVDIGEPRQLRFVGSGGIASRKARVFLAVDPAAGTLEPLTGDVENRGAIAGTPRELHEVRGAAVWRDADGSGALKLCSNAEADDSVRIAITARVPRWTVVAPLASLGPPQVGMTGSSPRGRLLRWRYRSGDAWRSIQQAPLPAVGAIEIAILDTGDFVLDRARVIILPEALSISARAVDHGCEVRCVGLPLENVGIEGAISWRRIDNPGGGHIHATWSGPAPTELTVTTRLMGAQPIDVRHHVRVRGRRPMFLDGHLVPVPENRVIVGSDLRSLRARSADVGDHAEITGRLGFRSQHAIGAHSISMRERFVDDLPMRRLRERLLALLGVADDLDARVSLELLRNGVTGARLFFRYFNRELHFDRMSRCCTLDSSNNESDALEAWPIQRPGEKAQPLPKISRGQWQLPSPEQPGIWLIIGAASLEGQVRPRVWYAGPGLATDCRLAGLATVSEEDARRNSFRSLLQQIADDPWALENDEDWRFVEDTIVALQERVPLISVDMLRSLADVPEAWLGLLLRASDERLPSIARIPEELAILPALIPLSRWRKAITLYRQRFSGIGNALVSELTASRLRTVVDHLPQLSGAAWYVREVFGIAHPTKDGEMPFAETLNPEIRRHLERWVGPTMSAADWSREIAATTDWGNLSAEARRAAPTLAAAAAISGSMPSPIVVAAMRFVRDDAPDAFDRRFRESFQLRLSELQCLP